jgi:MerR family transcriptional regulator, light-induced transcriptional regulator
MEIVLVQMAAYYPIRAVSKLTGISPDTLRAWERRYQAVQPDRSGRGRRYGEQEVARLRRLNQLVQRGHAIGGIAVLSDDALDELLATPAAPTEVDKRGTALPTDLLAGVLSAITDFDSARANDELTRLAAVLAPKDFVYQAVLPLMREVGTRWHDGRLTVAQEHLVSQMLRNLLGSLMRLYRSSTSSRRMIVATPAGESHEFGALAASMLAAIAGIDVLCLGADLPAEETARAARSSAASVVLYGITVVNDRTLDEVESLARAMPETTTLWLGGAGVASLDLSALERPAVVLRDLSEFEDECRRWSLVR